MQTAILLFLLVILLIFVALAWRGKTHKPTGGNAANTDAERESLYSLLGDNSGRMKK